MFVFAAFRQEGTVDATRTHARVLSEAASIQVLLEQEGSIDTVVGTCDKHDSFASESVVKP